MDKRAKALRFVRLPTGCFVPVSHKLNKDGYFRKRWSEDMEMFHRFVWRARGNPIPEGHEIDHLCNNRACCNPEHLQCVTRKEHLISTNKERYAIRKSAAHAYWRNTRCTGVALGKKYEVSDAVAAKWIKEWKENEKLH